jgi:hypothetical protein
MLDRNAGTHGLKGERVELHLERYVRIDAPLQLVWDETGSLDQLLAKSPHISTDAILPGGTRATGTTRIAWDH